MKYRRFSPRRLIALWCVLAALLLPGGALARSASEPAAPYPLRLYLPMIAPGPPPPMYLGLYLPPNGVAYPQQMNDFEAMVGKKHAIYHYYVAWDTGWVLNSYLLVMIIQHGSTPMVTWMSVPGAYQGGCGDPSWNLDSILNGSHDGAIAEFARGLAGWGHTIFLRWGHEMNITEYSWSGGCNGGAAGNAPAKYIATWRHIHDLFVQNGATNAKWVWSPSWLAYPQEAWNDLNNYYPGDAYVDWIGVTGYNWGVHSPYNQFRWLTFGGMFDSFLRDQTARHPDKPQMIADCATNEGDSPSDKPAWFANAFTSMLNYPNLNAVVYFDDVYGDARFQIDSSAASVAAYRSAITPSRFSSAAPYP